MKIAEILTMMIVFAGISYALAPVSAVYESTSPWAMYRHDLSRSGVSASGAPDGNDTLLWSHGRYISESAIVAEGRVIFPSSTVMYALDQTTGVELWNSVSFPNTFSTTAAYDNGRIYAGTTGGYMYCMNVTTGAKLWEYQVEGGGSAAIESSPAVYGGKVYFGTNGGHLYSLNASTGTYISRYQAGNAIKTAPAIEGDFLYFGCEDGKVYALNRSQTLFQLKWTYTVSGSSPRVRSTPTVSGDFLLFQSQSSDHSVYAVNRITGTLIWKFTFSNGWDNDNGITVAEGLVYCAPSGGNKVYALYLNATAGINYTENNPDIQLWAHTLGYYPYEPTFADGKIFVCQAYSLYALNAHDGNMLWYYTFSTYYPTDAVVADGHLFVCQGQFSHCFGDPFPPHRYVFTVEVVSSTFYIELVTNATVKDPLGIGGLLSLKKINYTLMGIDYTNGMSNITIPNELLGGPYVITVDGGLPNYEASSSNGTHTSLYFTYAHSSHMVEIVGTTVIPEFPTAALMLALAASSTGALVIVRKRRAF